MEQIRYREKREWHSHENKGYLVNLPQFGLKVVLAKSISHINSSTLWKVTEFSTGIKLHYGYYPTRATALSKISKLLTALGSFEICICLAIKKYGILNS